MKVVHLFTDIYMGYAHAGLNELLQKRLKTKAFKAGELAVFVNRGWTACKVLTPMGLLAYYKEPTGRSITLEHIRKIPTLLGGSLLSFGGATETQAMRNFEKKFGAAMKRVKAVGE